MGHFSVSTKRVLGTTVLVKSTQIYCADFFASSLPSDTTTVMVFGVTPLMTPLSIKLAKETRPGVFVLSYRFVLPIQESDDESTRDLLRAKLVYDYEEMRIYKVVGVASEMMKERRTSEIDLDGCRRIS